MGSTRPKPDLTVGLSLNDFTEEETQKLKAHSSLGRPSFVTSNLCYPFIMAEAKTLNKADRQNVHSAGIAVSAIIELQKAAFETTEPDRVQALFRKPLVFSVSHNGRQANLYAHFALPSNAVAAGSTIERCEIDVASFFLRKGVDRYKPYNFTLNIYQIFAREHRQMIKNALAALPTPSGLSFVTSDLALDAYSQQESQTQDETVSQNPSEDVTKLVQQLREAQEQLREAQEKEESMVRRLQQLGEQIDQQNKDSRVHQESRR